MTVEDSMIQEIHAISDNENNAWNNNLFDLVYYWKLFEGNV